MVYQVNTVISGAGLCSRCPLTIKKGLAIIESWRAWQRSIPPDRCGADHRQEAEPERRKFPNKSIGSFSVLQNKGFPLFRFPNENHMLLITNRVCLRMSGAIGKAGEKLLENRFKMAKTVSHRIAKF